ncbi:hypothetical protein CRENBAI_008876 [Crenichthys baileyi]|uniref:Uncharacterized protein n=1 Tax=Crenichthys baileyi TaxID=28760 RepID=A0AAV9RMI7_9TELE
MRALHTAALTSACRETTSSPAEQEGAPRQTFLAAGGGGCRQRTATNGELSPGTWNSRTRWIHHKPDCGSAVTDSPARTAQRSYSASASRDKESKEIHRTAARSPSGPTGGELTSPPAEVERAQPPDRSADVVIASSSSAAGPYPVPAAVSCLLSASSIVLAESYSVKVCATEEYPERRQAGSIHVVD